MLNQLAAEFSDFRGGLLIGLGFDPRCLTVLSHFPKENVDKIIGVSNAGWSSLNQGNIDKFRQMVAGKHSVIGQGAKNIIEVTDQLMMELWPALSEPSFKLIIDVTSLSHELLIVIIGMLHKLNVLNRTTLLYVGAFGYSTNTNSDAMWLSRGIKDIRSVLGFPGVMLPSKKLHLIILTGFEVERAAGVILRYEPSSVSIGLGDKEKSISSIHHDKNKEFFSRISEFASNQNAGTDQIFQFTFSCVSPSETKDELLGHIQKLGGVEKKNFIVCPLNTKLSTVGVALAAIHNQEIQICYAEPEEYNTEGYATPGNEVTIVSLS